LKRQSVVNPFSYQANCFGLIARRRKGLMQAKRAALKHHDICFLIITSCVTAYPRFIAFFDASTGAHSRIRPFKDSAQSGIITRYALFIDKSVNKSPSHQRAPQEVPLGCRLFYLTFLPPLSGIP
jgi:hypothetical protein